MRIRNSCLTVTLAALLLVSGAAIGQEQKASDSSGSIDVSLVGSNVDGDNARFQRYRDLRDGPFGGPFRFHYNKDNWFISAGADSVGRHDQRYFAEIEQPGKLTLSFAWDQVPLFYKDTSRTLYTQTSPGVLRIADSIQQGIQDGLIDYPDVIGEATQFDLRSRRKTASFGLEYWVNEDLAFNAKVDTFGRTGAQPWGASFGFGSVVEVAAPLDNRTTDVTTALEWGNDKGMIRVAYEGSWFDNKIQTLTWDNPRVLVDSTNPRAYIAGDGTSQGRMALWPSNTRHTVSATGTVRLPGHSHITGVLAVGKLDQDQTLLPFTINTAIEEIPLSRPTAAASVDTLAGNLAFTARPARDVRVNARYRYYDWDNKTAAFDGEEYVRFDEVLEEGGEEASHYHNMTRQQFDADVSYSPVAFTQVKVGYGYGHVDRTGRIFETTKENTFRASIDTTGNQYFTLRAKYEYSKRDGSGLDLEELEEVGEQEGMRHFDIADRKRQRFTGIATVMPSDSFSFNLTAGVGKDDYPDSEFGLNDNKHQIYGFGFDATPDENVSLGAAYTYEKYETLQSSRNASPGPEFDDPTRNWSASEDEKVHTVSGNVELRELFPKTDVRMSYDYSKSSSQYGFIFSSGLGDPVPLPSVENKLQRATVDARYKVTEQLTIGATYWYDQYKVDDYALGPDIGLLPSSGMLLGYFWEPYNVHTGWVRIIYSW